MVKNPPASAEDARDTGLIPGLGRSPGGGNGNPVQYSCLGNPMDREAWQAAVGGVTKIQTRLRTAKRSRGIHLGICVYDFSGRGISFRLKNLPISFNIWSCDQCVLSKERKEHIYWA